LGRIELARFANPAGLESMGQNLLAATPASGEATTGYPLDEGMGRLVQGQLGGQLVMVQVQATDHVAVGDTIVSAGLTLTDAGGAGIARSPYPRGLLIGTIQALELDPDALTQTAFVRPALDFSTVERLLVVLHFDQG